MLKNILKLTIFLCILVLLNCSTANKAFADSDSSYKYKGKGEALIINNDTPKAKQEALHEAFKDVLRKGVGVYIKGKTEVQDAQVVYNKVLSESEGYISNYNITKEKTEDGVYSVEIEANVSDEKIEKAFNQRLAKFIEANLIGSGTISISLSKEKNVITNCFLWIYGPVNDPTIEMKSIYIKLPKSGWYQPKIDGYGTINSYNIKDDTKNSLKFLSDVIEILKTRKTEVKLKNPSTNEIEVRPLAFDQFGVFLSEDLKPIIPPKSNITYDEFGKDDYDKMINFLEKIQKEKK